MRLNTVSTSKILKQPCISVLMGVQGIKRYNACIDNSPSGISVSKLKSLDPILNEILLHHPLCSMQCCAFIELGRKCEIEIEALPPICQINFEYYNIECCDYAHRLGRNQGYQVQTRQYNCWTKIVLPDQRSRSIPGYSCRL